MSDEEPLVFVFVPALVAVLRHAEIGKGAPLTEDEVNATRDAAICITVRRSQAEAMEASRGYPDIDPENAWIEWQAIRDQIGSTDE